MFLRGSTERRGKSSEKVAREAREFQEKELPFGKRAYYLKVEAKIL